MSEPPLERPEFSAPSYAACYLHPDRSTLISCQRCGKPICGECMNPASVGFQCPNCVRGGGTPFTGPRPTAGTGRSGGRSRSARSGGWGAPRSRSPRTVFGANLSNRQAPMTKAIMIALAAVWVLGLLSRGLVTGLLQFDGTLFAYGNAYWQLVTSAFVSYGLLAVLMNALVLWLAGQALEEQLGAWRFLALYVLSGAGGATLFFLITGGGGIASSSAAVVGLLAANGVIKLKRREDVRGDVALLILLLLYAFAAVGISYFASQLGGMLVGALTGVTLAYAPRRNRTALQVAGLVVIAVLCVGVVLVRATL